MKSEHKSAVRSMQPFKNKNDFLNTKMRKIDQIAHNLNHPSILILQPHMSE